MKRKNLSVLLISALITLSMAVPVLGVTGAQSVVITGEKTVSKGKTIELDSVIFPDYADVPDYQIVWSSSNSKVAKVLRKNDDETRIKGMKAGKATITVKISGTNLKASCKVTVKKAKKKKSGAAAAKKKIKSYRTQAKKIKSQINRTTLAANYAQRRSQYFSLEGKLKSVEHKLERIEEQWETKYEFGQVSYKTYRSVEKSINSADYYLETVEHALNQKFNYEFDD